MTESVLPRAKALASDMSEAIAKGHKGFTIRGDQMSIAITAIHQYIEQLEKKRYPADAAE